MNRFQLPKLRTIKDKIQKLSRRLTALPKKMTTAALKAFQNLRGRLAKLPGALVIACMFLLLSAAAEGLINTYTKAPEPMVKVETEKPKEIVVPTAIPQKPDVVSSPTAPEQIPDSQPLKSDGEPAQFQLTMPLQGTIVREFGFSYSPTFADYRFHDGIDIQGPQGAPVVAAENGKVVEVDFNEMERNIIVIEHAKGWRTHYKQLGKVEVKKGETLTAGQTIAKITEPGSHDQEGSPHLHFGLSQDDKFVNPKEYL